MRWPVSRERYDEALSRLAALEKEHKTLLDKIFWQRMGFQLYGTLTEEVAASVTEQEPELTDAQRAEQEYEQSKESEVRRLKSIARTSPSRLAPELRRAQAADVQRRAQAARPAHMTQAPNPAMAIFDQAKKEVAN